MPSEARMNKLQLIAEQALEIERLQLELIDLTNKYGEALLRCHTAERQTKKMQDWFQASGHKR